VITSALTHKKGNRRVLEKESLPHNLGNQKLEAEIMRKTSKQEYLFEIRERYLVAPKKQQSIILDEFTRVCQYNRKYAIRLLNTSSKKLKQMPCRRPGRPKHYDSPELLQFLTRLWQATNLACSKRLKAMIPLWLPWYRDEEGEKLSPTITALLLRISHSTIDRLLTPQRSRYSKIGLSSTKPGSLLRQHIPIRTNQWDQSQPGFLEADTVAHCGSSLDGMFLYTVNTVDIATGWTEQRAVWGKGEMGVFKAIQDIEQSLPFRLRGFDCDNGGEFLNWHLLKYLHKRRHPVDFTRSREYHKDDNAHIEGKNWTHVRQYLGYQRFDDPSLAPLLNELYRSEWRLFFNFCLPSMKLISKERFASAIIKRHDAPQTPYHRVMASSAVPTRVKHRLRQQYKTLDPFLLSDSIGMKIKHFFRYRAELLTPSTSTTRLRYRQPGTLADHRSQNQGNTSSHRTITRKINNAKHLKEEKALA
jgi:hypothetical protein